MHISNPKLLIIIVIILGINVSLFLYWLDEYSLLYYGDATSHLVSSRKIIDWQDAGLHQIGTVWLPLPHILFLLPSLIDEAFFTGFVGTIVNLPALSLTTLIIYKIIAGYINDRSAFFIALLYPTNPNILYLALTAMTESIFMLFFMASAFFFLKFRKDKSYKNILLCSTFIILATLCRYEAWFLPIFLIAYFILKKQYKISLIALFSFTGILFWLSWNMYYYNDPLEFANAEYYSASWQANFRYREMLFLNPLNVFDVYGINMMVMFGPLIASIFGYKRDDIFLVLLPVFTITSMLIGIGEISFWFNSRFLIFMAPFLLLVTARLYGKIGKRKFTAYLILIFIYNIIMILFTITDVDDNLFKRLLGVITYLDAKDGFLYNKAQIIIGEFLKENYDYGNILIITGSNKEHRIMLSAWIKLDNYDEIIESSTWKRSFKEPWLYNRWIVISEKPDSDAITVSRYWLENISELYKYYDMVYEYEGFKVFKRKY